MAGQIPFKDGAAAPADGKKRLTKLSKDEVAWILAHEPPRPHYDDEEHLLKFLPQEMIDRQRETMRLAAEAQESLGDKFVSFQCWVRKELVKRTWHHLCHFE
jgi:hypothetical protein